MSIPVGRKRVSTTVYLDEDQLIALKAMSVKSGAPMAYMIRKAIDRFIARGSRKRCARRASDRRCQAGPGRPEISASSAAGRRDRARVSPAIGRKGQRSVNLNGGSMAASSIEWTDRVWNPTVGCTKVSAGCKHCYAEVMHARLTRMGQKKYAEPFTTVKPWPPHLAEPLAWRKPSRIFVNGMSDLFHEDVPDEYIAAVFGVISNWHTYQILTNRAERLPRWFDWCEREMRGRHRVAALIEHASVMVRDAGDADAAEHRASFAASARRARRATAAYSHPEGEAGISAVGAVPKVVQGSDAAAADHPHGDAHPRATAVPGARLGRFLPAVCRGRPRQLQERAGRLFAAGPAHRERPADRELGRVALGKGRSAAAR
jgi:hypothetical protein